MCDISDILYVGRSQGHWLLKPYYDLLRWRWLNQHFGYYWEGKLKQAGGSSSTRLGCCAGYETGTATNLCAITPIRTKVRLSSHIWPGNWWALIMVQ